MLYIIDNSTSYTTITCYEHAETKFIELSKYGKNAIGFGYITEEKAISTILKEKMYKLTMSERADLNIKFHKGQLDKREYALQGLKKTRKKSVIDFIERNL